MGKVQSKNSIISQIGGFMSQNQRIRKYLESGRKLTALKALNKFGCLRLAARISDLKYMGLDIHKTMIKQSGKRYAEYRLG